MVSKRRVAIELRTEFSAGSLHSFRDMLGGVNSTCSERHRGFGVGCVKSVLDGMAHHPDWTKSVTMELASRRFWARY